MTTFDGGLTTDGGATADAGHSDGGSSTTDGGPSDGGTSRSDGGALTRDGGSADGGGADAGTQDGGNTAETDGGALDGGVAGPRLAFEAQPQTGNAGTSLAPVQVAVVDAMGVRLTDAFHTVKLALVSAQPVELQGVTTTSTTGGLASFSGLRIDRAGTGYRLRAEASGLESVLSDPFDIAPGATSGLTFLRQPEPVERTVWMSPVEVAAVDAFGNVAAAQPGRLWIALEPAGGNLTGTLTRWMSSGVARFDDLKVNQAGTFVLRVGGIGPWTPASEPFEVTDSVPPKVVVTNPTNISGGVDPSAHITVVFSEPLDAATVNAGSFTVTSGDDVITGTLSIAGSSVVFTPSAALPLGAEISVEVSTGIRDAAGNPLPEPYRFSFFVDNGIWSSTRILGTEVRRPLSVTLATGRSLVVGWCSDNGGGFTTPYYWRDDGPRQSLQAHGTAGEVAAGADDGGTVIAVFTAAPVPESPHRGLWWQTCPSDGGACSSAQLLDGEVGRLVTAPRLIVRPSGQAFAVWKTWLDEGAQTAVSELRFSRYSPGTGWQEPVAFASMRNDPAGLRVVANGVGDTLVVWTEFATEGSYAWRWSAEEESEILPLCISEEVSAATVTDVAIDGQGRAIATCSGWNLAGAKVAVASRFDPTTGWGLPIRLNGETGGAPFNPRVALNAAGQGVALWFTNAGALKARSFLPDEGWLPEATLQGPGGALGARWDVGIDPEGRASAVWWAPPDATSVHYRIYGARTDAGGWQAARELFEGAGHDITLQLEHLRDGRAVVAFSHGNGVSDWWVRALMLR